jgi:hypothetical protein
MKMHPELQDAVDSYRKSRGFDPAAYLAAKTTLLNAYFSQSGIKSCVVGISGGVDSALVAALLAHALRAPGSPLQHVAPLLLPMHGEGATHQRTARAPRTSARPPRAAPRCAPRWACRRPSRPT